MKSRTRNPKRYLSICRSLAGMLALALALGAPAQSVEEEPQEYLIKLREQPVAAYMAARNGGSKGRANLQSQDAASYRSQLRARQAAVKQRLQSLLQATAQAEMDTVFNGFAVTLRAQDVEAVRQLPEVEQVFPSIRYQKMLDAALPLMHVPESWAQARIGGEDNAGAGVRIAVVDTGVDINHPMLQDASLVPPAGFPRFTAGSGPTSKCPNANFTSDQRFTNSKVIVARNYVSLLGNPDPNCDAMDRDGHGTFIAGAAAGRRVQASAASISGIAPKAFIGSYKVFGTQGVNEDASSSGIIKAVDDAVKDGMNVINLSLGSPADGVTPDRDALALAVGVAVDSGVTVVTAAGNTGPSTGTITTPGIAPKAITVGATTNGRIFANPLTISAATPVPPEIATVATLPSNGPKIQTSLGPVPIVSLGVGCDPLPPGSLTGRIALIKRSCCRFSTKIMNAFEAGAVAAVVYNHEANGPAFLIDVGSATQIPAVMIGNREGVALEQLLAMAGSGAHGLLEATQKSVSIVANQKTEFSANGPSTDFGIKPDLAAPGTNLYSAAQRNDSRGEQYDASGFLFGNGTSFSTGLVSGAAALVKQAFPAFSPAQIKSALVNTAARVVTTASGSPATVLTQGNGLLDLAAALATPATVAPVSISFGSRSPGSSLNTSTSLSVTNTGAFSDSFTVTAEPRTGSSAATLTASPASFILGSGATTTVTINANSSGPVTGTIEGTLTIQSQNSQKKITVPYWGTFVRPTINSGGIVNAAGYSFSNPRVAAGSLISIFGSDLSADGTTVRIGNVVAPVLFASDRQINAQVPFELEGTIPVPQVVVQVNGISSAAVSVSMAAAAPGIFTVGQNGQGAGIIAHNSDFTLVTASNPARPGESLALFATGLGAVSPSMRTGVAGVTSPLSVSAPSNMPSVTIGGVAAPVRFSGLAPCFLGIYQVNIEVPSNVPKGEQTLVLVSNGVASNPVRLAIGEEPSPMAFGLSGERQETVLGSSLCSALPGLTFPKTTG
ncbi:MAG: S8 family serine peptidase [Acidobacteria bacterium]|nr:S8 family serine peptidase [Acidobacteriota bacterium]